MAKGNGNKKGGKDKGGNKGDANTKKVKKGQGKPPASAEVVVRQKGPAPKSYKPAAKISETMQTVAGTYNGFCGLVKVHDMQFRFSAETSEDGGKFNVVRLVYAPPSTELCKVKDFKTGVKLESLKSAVFVSDYEKGTEQYELQAKIWKFWTRVYSKEGLHIYSTKKVAPAKAPAVEVKASASVADFVSYKKGAYSFEASGPKVVVLIEGCSAAPCAPQFGATGKSTHKIKLISVDEGHSLSGCKVGTFLYYRDDLFSGKTPTFTGSSAKDCGKLYAYLANVLMLYRRAVVDKIVSSQDASQGAVVGEKVAAKLAHRRVAQAA
ncbi:MAG: hypothetical protein M0P64_03670 [Candidatus Pacebacteria bacterium]|jgi:hypothetical protein|nr:hypothetical protein [Candidatus Paceibacterota bacterium]